MKTLKLIFAMLFATILLSGCIFENKEAIFTINSEPITQAQYDKSYGDLKMKMGIEKEYKNG